jgi:hypothetical protein
MIEIRCTSNAHVTTKWNHAELCSTAKGWYYAAIFSSYKYICSRVRQTISLVPFPATPWSHRPANSGCEDQMWKSMLYKWLQDKALVAKYSNTTKVANPEFMLTKLLQKSYLINGMNQARHNPSLTNADAWGWQWNGLPATLNLVPVRNCTLTTKVHV